MSAPTRFSRTDPFRKDLNHRVKQYFQDHGLDERGNRALHVKTALYFVWVFGVYGAILAAPMPDAVRAVLCVVLGLGLAGFVFNVGHDANHGAYSHSDRVNALLGLTFDFIGASSHLWRFRHNVVHHTYTNVAGVDHDISSAAPFMRTTENDPHYAFHRYQHLYGWFLYALLPANWLASDANGLFFSRSYGGMPVPPPRTRDLVAFFVSKSLVLAYLVVLPALLGFGLLHVLLGGALILGTMGLVLAVVFQLAHVVEAADVVYPSASSPDVADEWAVHQLRTCVDFAPRNRLLTWYLGGLNHQVIHHLFPRISHVHYPALAPIVDQTARDHGLTYQVRDTFREALVSHYRVLRRLASADAVRPAHRAA